MHAIAKQTYSNQVTEYIKQCILAGEFSPGDKVSEVEIAARLSISRAPVREALQMLVQDGIVVSHPQRGKFITALTAQEIENSYFMGGVLEGAAAAATSQLLLSLDFSILKNILKSMEKAASGEDLKTLAMLDTSFHDVILSKTNNTQLVTTARRSCRELSKFLLFRYWQKIFTAEEVFQRHVIVFEALRGHDSQYIEKTFREHYSEAGKRMAYWGIDAIRAREEAAGSLP